MRHQPAPTDGLGHEPPNLVGHPSLPSAGEAVDHLPLVERVVCRLARRLPAHLSRQDLISAGVVALLEAMRRFDPARGVSFAAFAERRIFGAALDELRRADMMARDARQECKRIEAAVCTLTARLHRPASEDEVATHLGLTHAQYVQKLDKLAPVRLKSFDEDEHSRRGGHGQSAALSADFSPFDSAQKKQSLQALTQAIEKLTGRQQQVLHLYYREELTMKEIGAVLGVTESRVCQIMAAAIVHLRVHINEPSPRHKAAHKNHLAQAPDAHG